MERPKIEYKHVVVAMNADVLVAFNEQGKEGWRPSGVMFPVQLPDGTPAVDFIMWREASRVLLV